MIYGVRLMSSGWAPPESGPARDEYLRSNGEAFLSGAQAAVASVAAVLGPQKIPVVTLTGDQAKDRAQVGAVVRRWFEIREKYADTIESELREPIEAAVSNSMDALNFLEDTELRDTAHALVHQTALLRFGLLGCRFRVEEDAIASDCPVRIAHHRWGLSPEIVTEWACSICRQRFDTCSHIPGEEYEVVIDRSGSACSGCFEEACAHTPGEIARVAAHQIAVSIDALAVAVVARPRDPRARIVSVPVEIPSGSELLEKVRAGDGICTECILPCTGFVEHD